MYHEKYQDCGHLWIATGICDEHAVLQNVTSFSWINAFFLILSRWKFKHIELIGPVCQVINISNIPIKLFDFCKFIFFSREKYLKQNSYTNINCRFIEKISQVEILHKYYLPYWQHFATLLTCQDIVCPLETPENPKKVKECDCMPIRTS